eukprot:scaffold3623_cov144-Skeletonema_dohrnii-CCMP3373.AAC.3
MKLSTVAAALLLSSEAYASHEETSTRTRTRRMRSINIYSSTPPRNELDKDIVDPYIGLPDESEQRGLAKHNKPKPSVELESVPNPTTLEMSMPTAASVSMSAHQSLSYPLQHDSNLQVFIPEQRGLKKGSKSKPKPSKGSVPTLEMSMPTAASMPDVQSFSYSLQDATSTEESAGLPHHRRAAEEGTYNSAKMMGHSSVVAAAAIVSTFAGVAALV